MAADEVKELSIPNPEQAKLLGLPDRFQPRNLTELMTWAKLVTASQLAPKGMNDAAVVLCVQMGAELNITPTQALQNIAVINGRPSLFGDLGLAIFKRDSKCKMIEEDAPALALKQGFGRCKITMQNGQVIERTFSVDEAKGANLWGKDGPWKTYPGRMLMFRARWWAMRDADPGVFKGCAGREEQQDVVDVTETTKVDGEQIRAPRRASEGVPADDVADFLKNVKPTSSSGAPVDRSKLQKVMIKDSNKRTSGATTWYEVMYEGTSGGTKKATTFHESHHALATSLKGGFAMMLLEPSKKKDRDGNPYINITHIEAESAEAEVPPGQDEPGSGG